MHRLSILTYACSFPFTTEVNKLSFSETELKASELKDRAMESQDELPAKNGGFK